MFKCIIFDLYWSPSQSETKILVLHCRMANVEKAEPRHISEGYI